jgi:hypothetical protein
MVYLSMKSTVLDAMAGRAAEYDKKKWLANSCYVGYDPIYHAVTRIVKVLVMDPAAFARRNRVLNPPRKTYMEVVSDGCFACSPGWCACFPE